MNNNKLVDMYNISCKIIDTYNLLVTLIMNDYKDSSQYIDTINDLYHYIDKERELYEKINIKEIDRYIGAVDYVLNNNKLFDLLNNLSKFKDVRPYLYRIFGRLSEKKDILSGSSPTVEFKIKKLNIDGKFLVSDFIENYIIVETYKYLYKRIINTEATNNSEMKFKNNLIKRFNISKIRECSQISLIELYGRKFNLDIEKIPKLNISSLIDIDGIGDVILEECIDRALGLIKYLLDFTDDNNSLEDVFEASIVLSEMEACLSILDDDSLEELIEFYDEKYCDESDSLVNKEVKRLIRRKEEEIN